MIYGDHTTGIIVQGATGNQGAFHIDLMNQYAKETGGRGVVAGGVTPGKGGQEVHGVPVYNSVREALAEHDASTSVLFVPGFAAGDSIMEAASGGIELVTAITEASRCTTPCGRLPLPGWRAARSSAELSRSALSRRAETGHHAPPASCDARQRGHHIPQRHAHL